MSKIYLIFLILLWLHHLSFSGAFSLIFHKKKKTWYMLLKQALKKIFELLILPTYFLLALQHCYYMTNMPTFIWKLWRLFASLIFIYLFIFLKANHPIWKQIYPIRYVTLSQQTFWLVMHPTLPLVLTRNHTIDIAAHGWKQAGCVWWHMHREILPTLHFPSALQSAEASFR